MNFNTGKPISAEKCKNCKDHLGHTRFGPDLPNFKIPTESWYVPNEVSGHSDTSNQILGVIGKGRCIVDRSYNKV